MRHFKPLISFLLLVILSFTFSGCWNYREVEKLAVVSGFGVDKKEDKYQVTIEIIDVGVGKDTKNSTQIITTEGITLFDSVRKVIKSTGKRLYFSHAEIIVLSKEVAEEGVVPILDWVARDAELRDTLHFLVSKDKSAKEIMEQKPTTSEVLSFQYNDVLSSQKSLSYALEIQSWEFTNELSTACVSATLPTIDIAKENDKKIPEIEGTGLFKKDKLIGFLNGEETKAMMFVKDKVKGGLLVGKERSKRSEAEVSLEILKNKTKLKPRLSEGKIIMEVSTETDVVLAEIGGELDIMNEKGLEKLKEDFEAKLQADIKNLVKKTQGQYGCDIFGFCKTIKIEMPDLWKQIEPKWENIYKNLAVEVHSKINIKNSAFLNKPLKVGE